MEAQDAVSLAATLGGTAVGIAGVLATLSAARRQQEAALTIAREQAERQERAAQKNRQQRHLESAYRALASWLAECEVEVQRLNDLLWLDGTENDPTAVGNNEASFGRPAAVFRESHMWTAATWGKMAEFFRVSNSFWAGCYKLHLAKRDSEASETMEAKVKIYDEMSDLSGTIGELYDVIDQVRAALRADLLDPSPLTLGEFDQEDR
ncbi:hypothetical protein [Micromonospora jinlongensis]|nr:hypothetical protein [Micromonospora jinlongensis]